MFEQPVPQAEPADIGKYTYLTKQMYTYLTVWKIDIIERAWTKSSLLHEQKEKPTVEKALDDHNKIDCFEYRLSSNIAHDDTWKVSFKRFLWKKHIKLV